MRRNDTTHPGQSKRIARLKYAERQIEKYWKWSWSMRGKVRYKDIVKLQDKYKIFIG